MAFYQFDLKCGLVKTGLCILSSSILVWLGKRSFPIYLFHQAASFEMHRIWYDRSPQFSNLAEFFPTLLALLITLILSDISYRYYEKQWILFGKMKTKSLQT